LPILDTLSVMIQRSGERRSPFSADKNHIHHKLLALGFQHHEAVMVIYIVQGVLFVTAYFLRYESDLVILGFLSAFFAASIALLQIAARGAWRLRHAQADVRTALVPRFVVLLYRPQGLPRLTYAAIAVALGAYGALIVVKTASLQRDLQILILALLAVIGIFAGIMRVKPLGFVEKAALFVSATLLVYLDMAVLPYDRSFAVLSWVLVSVAALATAIRLRLFNDRRFQLTPLDLIVLFVALVVPNLTGTMRMPQGVALAIVKLVVIFYAIEMLVSHAGGRAVWVRLAAATVLAGLTLHSTVTS
jgi:UDP-GlcNAc:undecaprenyl-phosphate/decaprenyl-phosphate GlcNAc-1-phosphate transferase